MSFLSTQGGLNTTVARWSDAIGRWNPQLLRELRGTLTVKSCVVAVSAAWVVQGLLAYGVSGSGSGQWHRDALFLSRLIWVFLMALSGSASIAQNWVREAKLGTLDFLRLSPEPTWRILLGKMLGAPGLCYVAAIAWLPFHLYLAIRAGSDLGIWLATDLFNVSVLVTFLSIVLTLSTWAGKLNLMWAYILGDFSFILWPLLFFGAAEADEGTAIPGGFWWFGVDLSQSTMLLLGWGAVVMMTITGFCWSVACRRFNSPNATPLLRRQVYQLFAGFNLLCLGFFLPISDPLGPGAVGGWGAIATIWSMLQALVLWGTMPSRQQLMDWGRYQHFLRQNPQERNAQKQGVGKQRKRPWNPLIWNSNSPPFMVPLANLVITWVIWSPWVVMQAGNDNPVGVVLLLGLGITTAILTTIGAITVWIAIKMPRAQKFWLAAIAMASVTSLFSLGLFGASFAGLIGLSAIPASLISIAFARGALRQVGKSESQLMFDSSPQSP
ncbi:MAG: hypothetical protein AAF685_00065 [Cyanobacteria bacterium P01_C01_bin.89]